MNNDELMDYVLQNHPRFAKLFSEGENTVICDGVAAARAFELRKNPLSTVCRAGQYMMSVLRTEYRLCIVALDHRGIIKFERMIKLGPRWSSSALSSLLVEMLHPIPNAMVILGVTMKIKWNELMEFNKVYGSLKENGIDMVDLIEVHDGCFSSVIKMLSPKEGAEYEQFVSKKKQRKTESPLP